MAKVLIENYSFKIEKLRKSHFECLTSWGNFIANALSLGEFIFFVFLPTDKCIIKTIFVIEILIKFQYSFHENVRKKYDFVVRIEIFSSRTSSAFVFTFAQCENENSFD